MCAYQLNDQLDIDHDAAAETAISAVAPATASTVFAVLARRTSTRVTSASASAVSGDALEFPTMESPAMNGAARVTCLADVVTRTLAGCSLAMSSAGDTCCTCHPVQAVSSVRVANIRVVARMAASVQGDRGPDCCCTMREGGQGPVKCAAPAGGGYPFGMGDTDAAALAIQVRVLQAMPPADRLGLAFEMSQTARALLRARLSAEHPEWSPRELERQMLRHFLPGAELPARLP